MEQSKPLQYRTKLSSALLYSLTFVILTAATIYITLIDAGELNVSPSILLVLAFFSGCILCN